MSRLSQKVSLLSISLLALACVARAQPLQMASEAACWSQWDRCIALASGVESLRACTATLDECPSAPVPTLGVTSDATSDAFFIADASLSRRSMGSRSRTYCHEVGWAQGLGDRTVAIVQGERVYFSIDFTAFAAQLDSCRQIEPTQQRRGVLDDFTWEVTTKSLRSQVKVATVLEDTLFGLRDQGLVDLSDSEIERTADLMAEGVDFALGPLGR